MKLPPNPDRDEQIVDELDLILPFETPDKTTAGLLEMVSLALDTPQDGTTPAAVQLTRLVGAAFIRGMEYGRLYGLDEPTVKTNASLAITLFRACQALTYGTPAAGPIPRNRFMVTRMGDNLKWYHDNRPDLSPSEAVNLAVWLIALADPTLSDSVPQLLRLATR